jgi:chromosome segregation ATPase
VGALALFAYAFMAGDSLPKTGEKRGVFPGTEREEPVSEKLELQVSALESEIGKLTSEHALLKEQIELARNIEFDLREELTSFKILKDGWTSGLEKIDKLQPQEQASREMIDRISSLEARISEYKTEIEKQGKVVLEMKEKRHSEGPSEDEYSRLKKQLEDQEEALKKYKDENVAINSEYSVLKKQLQEKEEALTKLSQSQGISSQEYNRLKDKLAQAEEVLRIIHAEG